MKNKPLENAVAFLLVGSVFSILNSLNGLSDSAIAGGYLVGSVIASANIFLLSRSKVWVKFPTFPLLGMIFSGFSLAIGWTSGVYFGMFFFAVMAIVHDRVSEPSRDRSR